MAEAFFTKGRKPDGGFLFSGPKLSVHNVNAVSDDIGQNARRRAALKFAPEDAHRLDIAIDRPRVAPHFFSIFISFLAGRSMTTPTSISLYSRGLPLACEPKRKIFFIGNSCFIAS
ncbi:MAG TPA: hypothetical protein PKL57_19290 [Candidatus Wallbacteria bacterium]|nr:hypothetical protein [Candidatus Wallbacteria bacterium]